MALNSLYWAIQKDIIKLIINPLIPSSYINKKNNNIVLPYINILPPQSTTQTIPSGGIISDSFNINKVQANLEMSKSTNLAYADIGTTITYTVVIKNLGNVSANNINFTDTFNKNTRFVYNSMSIDGVKVSGSPEPPTGIDIGTIVEGGVSTITFDVIVYSIPSPNPISNTATTNYRYTVDTNSPNGVSGSSNSNSVETYVNNAKLKIDKMASEIYASVGTTITYTVVINNIGNISANNIMLIDTIPRDILFVVGSVKVDGKTIAERPDPPLVVDIGTISASTVSTVTFDVFVYTIPKENPIRNTVVSTYFYTVNPINPNGVIGSDISNRVKIQINTANLKMKKTRDLDYVCIGETVTYTVVLKNVGNVSANSIKLIDKIPYGTSFVDNSMAIDGSVVAGSAVAPLGIDIGSMSPGGVTTVSFKIIVNTLPKGNLIRNSLVANYKYTIDPSNPNSESRKNTSNIDLIEVNNANLEIYKLCNEQFADVGTTLTYTILLKNIGNVSANNIKITDIISKDLSFIEDSLVIDGVAVSGSSQPPMEINLSQISMGTIRTLTFNAMVNRIPRQNPIRTTANTIYKFTINPTIPNGGSGSNISNTNEVQVSNANLEMDEMTNLLYADVGTTITYTVVVKNLGNVSANNIKVTTTIPKDTAFIKGSMAIDGSIVSGKKTPQRGMLLSRIFAGAVSTITFDVVVNTIPSPNKIQNSSTAIYNYTVDPSVQNGVTRSKNSNVTEFQINTANLTMNKLSDTRFADVGTIITYIVEIKNVGNVVATSIKFMDTIPKDTTFIEGSMAIDGSIVSGSSVQPMGVSIGTIAAGNVSTVTFKVVVNTIPSPNLILNEATTSYKYTVDPSMPNASTGRGTSNVNKILVNNANLKMKKVGNPRFADVGTTITYTVVISNIGNVDATSINFKDTISKDTTFIEGSMAIDGSIVSGTPAPPVGVNIGTIAAGNVSTITFEVVVNTIPSPNIILNKATTSYKYTVDPSMPNSSRGRGTSNVTEILVNNANLTMKKLGNPRFADVGTTITYTVVINNTGNIAATSINLKDTISKDTTFIEGSMAIDGSIVTGSPVPPRGINIGTIEAGNASTVTFEVVVIIIPSLNPIKNISTATFNYTVDTSVQNGGAGSKNSNVTEIQVNNSKLIMKKVANPRFADVGTTITYTVVISNIGNADATSINFTDTIPKDTTFIEGSMAIDGSIVTGSPAPPRGINIGTIAVGNTSTITFEVVVNTIPSLNPIENRSTTTYNYTVDPSVQNGAIGSENSNGTEIQVNNANLTMNNISNPRFADVGTTITYTVVINNVGNVAATSIKFTDTLPKDITFIEGSMAIDGSIVSGTPAPPVGINIGTIAAGNVSTVTFEVVVNTIPSPNLTLNEATTSYKYTVDPSMTNASTGSGISNGTKISVNNAKLKIKNVGNPSFADIGTTITYIVVINNIGNVDATSISFKDTIPKDTTFIEGSMAIDGSIVSGTPAPPVGVNIGTIEAGNASTVTFEVVVNTIPSPNPIKNSSTATYNYTVDPSIQNGATRSENSNVTEIQVNTANLIMNKVSNPRFADIGTTITYTVVLSNIGNVSATSIKFTDTLPKDVTFIAGSMAIDGSIVAGTPAPPVGVNIGTIEAGNASTVTFEVVVNTIPSQNLILNEGTTSYKYTVDPSMINDSTGRGISNATKTPVNNANLKIKKVGNPRFADVGTTITYTVRINNVGNVAATSINFTDIISKYTTFIEGAMAIDGSIVSGTPAPPVGINIGTIAVGNASTITFDVVVISIPSPNPIKNSSTATYNYTVDPSVQNGGTGNGNSNVTEIQVNNANLRMNKVSKPIFADIGTTITYTVVINNIGNVSATSINFIDTIPKDTTFIEGSMAIDGRIVLENPASFTGVALRTMSPGSVSTVTFDVVVNTIPSPNPIENTAIINYKYTIDPSIPNGKNKTNISNKVQTNVSSAILKIDTLNNRYYSDINEQIEYFIVINNKGNVEAYDVVLTNTIPNDTKFIPNSLKVNGITVQGDIALPLGINIGTIPAGETTTLTFNVIAYTIPSPNPLPNSTIINYSYNLNEIFIDEFEASINEITPFSSVNISSVNTSLEVVTKAFNKVNNATLLLDNTRDLSFATIGDIINYTITLKNIGNVPATNIIVIDRIPKETSYVPESTTLNGSTVQGSPLLPLGINIGEIKPSEVLTLTFKVVVNTIASSDKLRNVAESYFKYTVDPLYPKIYSGINTSNVSIVKFNIASLLLTMISNPISSKVGQVINYTTSIRNIGTVDATNVIFYDKLPKDIKFITNSFIINGVTVSSDNLSLTEGVNIGSIGAGTATTVTFKVSAITIPAENRIINESFARYTYRVDPSNLERKIGVDKSNIVETTINQTNLEVIKNVDKSYANINSILIYTIIIKNTGVTNQRAYDLVFYDNLQNGIFFVEGSFSLNGDILVKANPEMGIILPSIDVGETIELSFRAAIRSEYFYKLISNIAKVYYSYYVGEGVSQTSCKYSNVAETKINNNSAILVRLEVVDKNNICISNQFILDGIEVKIYMVGPLNELIFISKGLTDSEGDVLFKNLDDATYLVYADLVEKSKDFPLYIPSNKVVLQKNNCQEVRVYIKK